MCKVYSKEINALSNVYARKSALHYEKDRIIIKNKNHNTCTGTAFIKPWRTGVKSQQLPGGKQNGQRFM